MYKDNITYKKIRILATIRIFTDIQILNSFTYSSILNLKYKYI